jgi:hypothetical protein
VNKSKKTINVISLILFALGIVLGVVFIGVASWGGMEGLFFDHVPTNPDSDKILTSLRCPLLISTRETAQISATITNSSKFTVRPMVTANISAGYFSVSDEFSDIYVIDPHSSINLNWQATVENAAYGKKLIMVHVKVFSSYPLPPMTGNCGIVVMNLGALKGETVTAVLSLAAMILISIGWWLWYRCHPVEKTEKSKGSTNGMRVLGLIVLVGILASFFKLWFLGVLALAVIVLMAIILWSQYAAGV